MFYDVPAVLTFLSISAGDVFVCAEISLGLLSGDDFFVLVKARDRRLGVAHQNMSGDGQSREHI